MGAQTDDRLTQYKKRYKDWEDPNGKISELNQQTAFMDGVKGMTFVYVI